MDQPALKAAPGLRYRLFLGLYAGALWSVQPLIWRYFRRRATGDPDYGAHMDERKGKGAPFAADVWVHAVSLGELKSAEPLIGLCLEAGQKVVTTHATPAGRRAAGAAFAEAIAAGQLTVRYAPVDLPNYWRLFFARHVPRVGLVMEMEFWPVMIEEARRAGTALCLSNSQVPGKSFARARRLARIAGHPVARAAGVFAKSQPIADRFRALGADPVLALGETRFDIPVPAEQVAAGKRLVGPRPVLTLASVVQGEESIYVRMLHDLLSAETPPLVIWVPRAPEMFEATAKKLQAEGFQVALRSEAFDQALASNGNLGDVQILVGDSMGEMFFYLAPADAVIVGGGFVEKGAHNVIEPLSLGKPVLTGPHVWTIEFPGVEARAAGVLTVVEDEARLAEAVRDAMAGGDHAAEAFHAQNRGASARIFEAIRPLLEVTR